MSTLLNYREYSTELPWVPYDATVQKGFIIVISEAESASRSAKKSLKKNLKTPEKLILKYIVNHDLDRIKDMLGSVFLNGYGAAVVHPERSEGSRVRGVSTI